VDRITGRRSYLANAIDPKTGERWTVAAHDPHSAACALARQLGFDLYE
jgi:hypothetical protein